MNEQDRHETPQRPLIEDRLGLRARIREEERAILVSLEHNQVPEALLEESLRELRALCDTAGVEVLRTLVQRRRQPHPGTFLGKGKAAELKGLVEASGAEVVVFNAELSPAQGRNLEELLGVKIIDRAQLIMDIFAQRAMTADAKLQVELAQLQYLLPRLRGWGEALSRLGGGIGTRGPGETKLTLERRQLRRRIHRIETQLEESRVKRAVKRKGRERSGVSQVALVGYTNAGKSTLLNALTDAGALAEDKLFATLNPVARRVSLPDDREAVLLDTVGFIRELPHQLVPAFQSTLESVREADLILHVMDSSNPQMLAQWEAVRNVFKDVLGGGEWPPVLHVFNKVDRAGDSEAREALEHTRDQLQDAVEISALHGQGLELLLQTVAGLLGEPKVVIELHVPYAKGQWLDILHRQGEVLEQRYGERDVSVDVRLTRRDFERLSAQAQQEGINWRVVDGGVKGDPPASSS